MLEDRFVIPRPPARHQATPHPAGSFVQRSGLTRRQTRTLPHRGVSGASGRPGRRKSLGNHQLLCQTMKSSGSPYCHPFHRRILTGASSRKPDDCDRADRPGRPEAAGITRCSKSSTGLKTRTGIMQQCLEIMLAGLWLSQLRNQIGFFFDQPRIHSAVVTKDCYNFNGITTWRTASESTAVIRQELSALFNDKRAFSPSMEPNASST